MKRCKSCEKCEQLYVKGTYCICPSKRFYCVEKDMITDLNNVCECWHKRNKTNVFSAQRFDDVIEDIYFLKEHFDC